MKQHINNFKKYSFLLEQLVKKEIKLKYRSSFLGVFWTLLEPFLTMLVLTLVFSGIKGNEDPAFPVWVLTGRLLYSYFANSTKSATKSIRKNAAMIKKVYVPKYIYVLASTIANYIMFLVSMIVLILTAIWCGIYPTKYIFGAIIPLTLLFIAALGVGLILATMAVFFRDLEYLWGVFLMLIMYTCAIFYKPAAIIESEKGWIFKINPLYALIDNFRSAIYGTPLDNYYLLMSVIFSFTTLIIGIYVFYKKQDKFILSI